MKNLPSRIILDDLVVKVSELLAKESIFIIRTYGKLYGNKFTNQLLGQFLSAIVTNMVSESLNRLKDEEETVEFSVFEETKKNFQTTKFNIQDSVARGFSQAFSNFNNQFVDYFCVIKPTEEPLNKKDC